MFQVPAALGALGSTEDDYQGCRDDYPANKASGYTPLTPGDPCWDKLVAWRRSTGRDPLGRDIWGPNGAPGPRPHRDETLLEEVHRCMEETGRSRGYCEDLHDPRASRGRLPLIVIPRIPSQTEEARRVVAEDGSDITAYAAGAAIALAAVALVLIGLRRGR
jgi:hypothetical protein